MRSWDSGPPLAFEALNQARHMIAEVKDFKVMPLAQLEKGGNYQIGVREVCQDKDAFILARRSAPKPIGTPWILPFSRPSKTRKGNRPTYCEVIINPGAPLYGAPTNSNTRR